MGYLGCIVKGKEKNWYKARNWALGKAKSGRGGMRLLGLEVLERGGS